MVDNCTASTVTDPYRHTDAHTHICLHTRRSKVGSPIAVEVAVTGMHTHTHTHAHTKACVHTCTHCKGRQHNSFSNVTHHKDKVGSKSVQV